MFRVYRDLKRKEQGCFKRLLKGPIGLQRSLRLCRASWGVMQQLYFKRRKDVYKGAQRARFSSSGLGTLTNHNPELDIRGGI